MKKYLFLLAAICMVAVANAQLVTTSSYTVKKEKSKMIWMVRAGLNVANVSCNDKDYADPKSIAGYNLSIEFNRAFATNFYWGSGLVLASGGYKISEFEKGSGYESSFEDKYTISKLELPLNFGYKFSVTDDFKLDAHLGAYIGYDLFGTNKYAETYNEDTDSGESKLGDWRDYNRLNAGLQFGVGAWYRNFNFNINFQKGLVNKFDYDFTDEDGGSAYNLKEKNWMFSVGYAF